MVPGPDFDQECLEVTICSIRGSLSRASIMEIGVIVFWMVWLAIGLYFLFFITAYAISEIISEIIEIITQKEWKIEEESFDSDSEVSTVEPSKESHMQ